MTYKIAICDDSQADRDYVASLVRRWASEGDRTAHIEAFSSAEGFLFHYAEESDFDILLLDIEMGGMDGVTMAKRLRQSNDTVQIIFITGYSDYIAEGYEVAALHYLVKPLDENKLFSVLDRAAEKLQKNEKVLHLELSGEMVRLPVHRIRWAEVSGNYVTIHANQDYTVKMTLAGKGAGRAVLPGRPLCHCESDPDQPGDQRVDHALGWRLRPPAPGSL